MMKIICCSMLALLLLSPKGSAAEGFWLPSQLTADSPVLQRYKGQTLPLTQLQQVSGRIDNCSAAFISKAGLLITNANCVASYLQELSVASVAPEMPVPGLQFRMLQQTLDVTTTINRQLSGESSAYQRSIKFEQIKQQLQADCEQRSQLSCELKTLHHGLEFYLLQYKTLRDVRLVYRPPLSTADADQRWPRYGADFVILRAYDSANNDGVAYAKDNTPYRSAFARLSQQGVTDDELVISPSFSVHSRRYATATEIQFNFEQLFPRSIEYLQQATRLLKQLAPAGSVRAEQYNNTLTDLTSEAEKLSDMLSHYQRSGLLSGKQQRQQAVLEWINSSAVRQQLYAPVLATLDRLLLQQQRVALRDLVLDYLKYAQLPALANQLYQHALQPNPTKAALLKSRMQQFDLRFDARVDLELALHFLEQYAKLPQGQRLVALDQYFALNDGFNREIVRHKLSAMYRGTSLTDANQRLQWLQRNAEQFQQSSDPLISFSVAMYDTVTQLNAERRQLKTALDNARAEFMEVLMAYNDAQAKATYAEANGMLRFSVGRVSGYQPVDAVWFQPFSTLQGMLKLSRSVNNTQPVLAEHAADKLTPVNFLSSIDSGTDYGGAPTFNTKGEVVGLLFCGVEENLLADWHYDEALSRAVHVDSRFIIWQLKQTDAGRAVLAELFSDI